MKTQVSQEQNLSRSSAHKTHTKSSSVAISSHQGKQFSTNASDLAKTISNLPAQRKLQHSIESSPRQLLHARQISGMFPQPLQRKQEEEKEELQMMAAKSTLQRQELKDKELLQGNFVSTTAQLKEEPASKPNNTGLPDNLKSGIESLSGISMDNVKVHYNSPQPAQLNALAYAQGTDIHVAPGQEKHLPHEAWHVVQQSQGRVKPTMQMKEGVPVNDDAGLEHEADVMGAKAMQKQSDGPD